MRTTDIMLLMRLEALLSGAGIASFRFDRHVSAVEGGIGAFPQRLMVADDDLDAARRLIRAENLGHVLYEADE